jgi:thiamine pyrophosphokinase
LRTIIIANGKLDYTPEILQDDYLIAADGGAHHCLELGLVPHLVIGDMDSLSEQDIQQLKSAGSQFVIYPSRKDYTDLELAISYAQRQGANEIWVYAALGYRWDQTLANLLIPAAQKFSSLCIKLVDGNQEIQLIRAGGQLELEGTPGDTVSLIPIAGDCLGITTQGLEYPLFDDNLMFGYTRGISNTMASEKAAISLRKGLLICILIHKQLVDEEK